MVRNAVYNAFLNTLTRVFPRNDPCNNHERIKWCIPRSRVGAAPAYTVSIGLPASPSSAYCSPPCSLVDCLVCSLFGRSAGVELNIEGGSLSDVRVTPKLRFRVNQIWFWVC